VVRILQCVFAVTSYIRLFNYVSTKDIVHCSGNTIDILCFLVDVISNCHCDSIVHNHGVRTPFITISQGLRNNTFITIASFIVSNGPNLCFIVMTNIRNTKVGFFFQTDEVVSSLLYILLNGIYFSSSQQTLCQHVICIDAQRECTQACQSTPCEGRTSTIVFTAIQSSINAQCTSTFCIAHQICLIGSIACRNIQFASCPVEFIHYISITVRATTLILYDWCIQRFKVCILVSTPVIGERLISRLCSLVSLFCICQISGSVAIPFLCQSCILCHSSSIVQGCSIGNRLYDTFQRIICRSNAKCCPLVVVNLVVNHAV